MASFFLHQGIITDAAFAVVPWLVEVCKKGETRFRVEYLTDLATVEAYRLTSGLHWHSEGTEEYPEWLMSDYRQCRLGGRATVVF